jgi:hypothetical protein
VNSDAVQNTAFPLRRYVATGILILYCLLHGVLLVSRCWRDYKQSGDPDSVEVLENRLIQVKEQLQRSGCKEVGYVTDIPESDPDWFKRFFRTQYALSPILIHDSVKPSLVIANLRDPSSIARIIRDGRLSVVSDQGSGVVLLSRIAP